MSGPINGKRRLRTAVDADLDRVVEIHFSAYPSDVRAPVIARYFTHNPYGRVSDLVVVEDDGTVVGMGFLFPLAAHFGGVKVRIGGIASIGVAPEARRRGVATDLLGELHRRSAQRGDACTMLEAFRHRFYAGHGYAVVSSRKRLVIDLLSIPESWRGDVRGVRSTDALRRIYARVAARSSGWLARSERLWERLLANETTVRFVSPGKGYVAFHFVQSEEHAETTIVVDELVAIDDVTRRALLASLTSLRDQVTECTIEVAEDDPLERALLDLDGRRSGSAAVEHSLGDIVGGPMVRIGDPAHAIEARGYLASGSFSVVVDDEPLSVQVKAGRARVTRKRGKDPLVTTRGSLAAMLYGGLSVRAAIALGLADGPDRANEILRIPALAPPDYF